MRHNLTQSVEFSFPGGKMLPFPGNMPWVVQMKKILFLLLDPQIAEQHLITMIAIPNKQISTCLPGPEFSCSRGLECWPPANPKQGKDSKSLSHVLNFIPSINAFIKHSTRMQEPSGSDLMGWQAGFEAPTSQRLYIWNEMFSIFFAQVPVNMLRNDAFLWLNKKKSPSLDYTHSLCVVITIQIFAI